jgi:hypothetical protein
MREVSGSLRSACVGALLVCSAWELPRNILLGAYLVKLLLSYKWLPVVVLKKTKVAKCPK